MTTIHPSPLYASAQAAVDHIAGKTGGMYYVAGTPDFPFDHMVLPLSRIDQFLQSKRELAKRQFEEGGEKTLQYEIGLLRSLIRTFVYNPNDVISPGAIPSAGSDSTILLKVVTGDQEIPAVLSAPATTAPAPAVVSNMTQVEEAKVLEPTEVETLIADALSRTYPSDVVKRATLVTLLGRTHDQDIESVHRLMAAIYLELEDDQRAILGLIHLSTSNSVPSVQFAQLYVQGEKHAQYIPYLVSAGLVETFLDEGAEQLRLSQIGKKLVYLASQDPLTILAFTNSLSKKLKTDTPAPVAAAGTEDFQLPTMAGTTSFSGYSVDLGAPKAKTGLSAETLQVATVHSDTIVSETAVAAAEAAGDGLPKTLDELEQVLKTIVDPQRRLLKAIELLTKLPATSDLREPIGILARNSLPATIKLQLGVLAESTRSGMPQQVSAFSGNAAAALREMGLIEFTLYGPEYPVTFTQIGLELFKDL